jgi:hypothetical protein
MLAETMVGQRLSDLRTVLEFLKDRPEIDAARLVFWGDSLQEPIPQGEKLRVPMGIDNETTVSEPLGGLLGLLAALYEPDIRGVYIYGGLISFESVLSSPFCYLPHDVVIPGAIPAGDLPALANTLDSSRLRLEGLVDGLNQQVSDEDLRRLYPRIRTSAEKCSSAELTAWMLEMIKD